MAVAALAAEVVFVLAAFLDAGEARAERDQLAHRVGAVAHDGFDRVPIAQPGAGAQRIVDVRLERVVDAPYAGDSALRVGGVGLVARGLGQHRDGAGLGRLDREHQSGDTAADNQVVALEGAVARPAHGVKPAAELSRANVIREAGSATADVKRLAQWNKSTIFDRMRGKRGPSSWSVKPGARRD